MMVKVGEGERRFHPLTWVFDGLSLLVFIGVAIYDGLTEDPFSSANIIVNVVIVLIPAVFSIISIALSLRQKHIYGLTINEFNRFRGGFYFTFFHKFMVFVTLVAALCICQALSLSRASICLNVISLVYAVIFGAQEIPILTLNEGYIWRVLKNGYKTLNPMNSSKKDNNDGKIVSTFRNILYSEGILTAYNILNYKEKKSEKNRDYSRNTLYFLLDIQNRSLWNVEEHMEIYANAYDFIGGESGPSFSNILDKSFQNIASLLKPEAEIELKSFYDKDEDMPIGQLTRTIFSLKRISQRFSIDEYFEKNLQEIVDTSIDGCLNPNIKPLDIAFQILMSLLTLKEEELWFLRAMRDNHHSADAIFSENYCHSGLFLSLIIYSMHLNGRLIGEGENDIRSFLQELGKGANSFGQSWDDCLWMMILEMDKVKIIDALLSSYGTTPIYLRFAYAIESGDEEMEEKPFDLDYLFRMWFNLLLYGVYRDKVNIGDFEKKLASLKEEHWETMERVLGKDILLFKEDEGYILNPENDYQDFFLFFNLGFHKIDDVDGELLASIKKFINEGRKMKLEETSSMSTDLDDLKKRLCDSFRQSVNFGEYLEAKETADPALVNRRVYHFGVNSFEKELNFRFIEKSLIPSLVDFLVKRELDAKIKRKDVAGKGFVDATFEKYVKKDYDYAQLAYSDIKDVKKEENMDLLRKMDREFVPFMPEKIFAEKKFASVYMKALEEKTIVRRLSDGEVNEVIARNFKTIDGAYVYNEFSSEASYSVLLSREELFKEIKNHYAIIDLYYEYFVEVSDERYFAFRFVEAE